MHIRVELSYVYLWRNSMTITVMSLCSNLEYKGNMNSRSIK
jgi:hypothetical protein